VTGFRIEKLHRRHAVETFDCGEEALNRFLVRFALANQMANASQTYVGLADDHGASASPGLQAGVKRAKRDFGAGGAPNSWRGSSGLQPGVTHEIIGFHTLVVGEARHEEAPERLTKGLALHPVPVMLLARLGVSVRRQGCGIGAGLLRDAILRTLQVADIAGVRALAVHAKNEGARSFYERFDFLPSPTDPLHLFALIKDLRKLPA